ncbi:MAG: hypothetical protein J0M12_05725 [Deltaproteobacteria bacterium]|nr:hypothetical protein [Deltaproteobacteria bacterium]
MKLMLSALRLAIALARIPRLFASLLLIPLILSLLLVYGQLVVTGLVVRTLSQDPKTIESTLRQIKQDNLGRRLLYGDGVELPPLKLCRWTETIVEGVAHEIPPAGCEPDKLDVALHVPDPAAFDAAQYEKIFNGNVERLHVCKTCQPHVVIEVGETENKTQVYSVWGMLILSLIRFNDDVNEQYINVVKNFDKIKFSIGDISFYSSGLRHPVGVRTMYMSMAVVFNIALLIIIAMWLALRAHRKVLDYFARSGALLPMVAATGKGVFYAALWILTFFRVGAFLFAAVPMTLYGFAEILRKDQVHSVFGSDYIALFLWVVAIVTSLGLATLISSISELKQRHQFMSFVYRYLPIAICAIGMLLWSLSFISDAEVTGTFRNVMTALPILGMGPVLIAPIFKPNFDVLAIHTVLTSLLFVIALQHNARWFAAHLEDL